VKLLDWVNCEGIGEWSAAELRHLDPADSRFEQIKNLLQEGESHGLDV